MSLSIAERLTLNGLSKTSSQIEKISEQLSTGKKINRPSDDPVNWSISQKLSSQSNILISINENLSNTQTKLNLTAKTMEYIDKILGQMKGQLSLARGNPPGSEMRSIALKSYNDYRLQIQKLTNENEDWTVRKLISDPSQNQDSGDIKIISDGNNNEITIEKMELHVGQSGLNIGQSFDGTDVELDSLTNGMTLSIDKLRIYQTKMGMTMSRINDTIQFNSQFSNELKAGSDKLTNTDMEESAVLLQSLQVQHSLSISVLGSISSMKKDLLRILS